MACVLCVTGEYQAPPTPPTPGKEQEGGPARRGSDGKLRGRKRANDPAPPLDSEIEVYMLLSGLSHTSQANMIYLTNKQATKGLYYKKKKQCRIEIFTVRCTRERFCFRTSYQQEVK